MAILLGGTQTESVQRPSQTASAMGSGLGGILGLAQALTEMDLPIPAADVATAGIGDLELDSTFGAMPSYLEQSPPPFYG